MAAVKFWFLVVALAAIAFVHQTQAAKIFENMESSRPLFTTDSFDSVAWCLNEIQDDVPENIKSSREALTEYTIDSVANCLFQAPEFGRTMSRTQIYTSAKLVVSLLSSRFNIQLNN